MKNVFKNLVKLGNNNPDLRENIRPVLHHLKKARGPDSLQGLHRQFEKRLTKAAVEKFNREYPSYGVGSMGDSYMWIGDWGLDFQVSSKGITVEILDPDNKTVGKEPFGPRQSISDIMNMLSKTLSRYLN